MHVAGMITAAWLGILTSISPCPLATNIAAVSYIGRQFSTAGHVILSGIVYAIGRMIAYSVIGGVVVGGLLSIPVVSDFLQHYMNRILGPLLILIGMILLGLFQISVPGLEAGKKTRDIAEKGGIAGAGLLGIIFALSFCPVSAALFFGSLIPLSIKDGSVFAYPQLYGAGTALPVMIFAFIIAAGVKSAAGAFDSLKGFESWARRLTGLIFILVGIYLSLKYIFEVPLIF
jgi:cytochrome c-type biogenesis protein